MNTNIVGTILLIPVSLLVPPPRNVRKHNKQSIEDLAASIRAHGGLIHNLIVTPANASGKYEVAAGEGRLLALRALIKAKALPKDFAVPCKVVSPEEALEISLAENLIRTAMHPADQFAAFKKLVDEGKPVEDVAAHFRVAPLVVKQRMKLANVSPALIAKFREDEITLEQMMALAVTDDHDAQERVWSIARAPWQREPSALRAALTGADVASTDRRAKYVGIDAYEKAGGAVRRDLFSDTVYFTDAALLDRLVDEKLARAAERVRKEGWGWVEHRAQCSYAELRAFARQSPTLRAPTKKEQAMLDKLDEQDATLRQEGEGEDVSTERLDEIDAALEAFAEKRRAIEDARVVDDPDAKAQAGALVLLDHDGKVKIERALVRRESRAAARSDNAKANGDADASATPKERPEFSDALTRRLTAERTLALRAVLAQHPTHALTVLVHSLVLDAFYHERESVLAVTIKDDSALARSGIDADNTKAAQVLHALREDLQVALPSQASELWAWMIAQDSATQLQYLAYCITPALNVMQDRATNLSTTSARPIEGARALAALLGLDMADWWQPTVENFCGGVPKAKLIEAVSEAKGRDAGECLAMMKKAGAIAAAAEALDGTRWLPSLLR